MIHTENKNERVMVFIDHANVDKSKESYYDIAIANHIRFDYEKMVKIIVGDRILVDAYVFNGIPYGVDENSLGFMVKLRYQGFIVDLRRNNGSENGQKGVDVSLAVQAVKHAYMDHYDTAIIVSGDKDFIPAIEAIRDAGKKVECVSAGKSTAIDVKKSVSKWTDLNSMDIVELPNGNDMMVEEIEVE